MKLIRLLQLKEQQEKQGRLLLQQAQGKLQEERARLNFILKQTTSAGNYFPEGAILGSEFLTTYTHYLAALRSAKHRQQEQVAKAKNDVKKALQSWEELRKDKEKLEKVTQRSREIQMAKEQRLEQAEHDEIGLQLIFRGGWRKGLEEDSHGEMG
jgi:flagellar export protein FliJ